MTHSRPRCTLAARRIELQSHVDGQLSSFWLMLPVQSPLHVFWQYGSCATLLFQIGLFQAGAPATSEKRSPPHEMATSTIAGRFSEGRHGNRRTLSNVHHHHVCTIRSQDKLGRARMESRTDPEIAVSIARYIEPAICNCVRENREITARARAACTQHIAN